MPEACHPHNRNMKHHAFEAILLERTGSESLLNTFRVTGKVDADEAYHAADDLCKRARNLPSRKAEGACAFVREINAPA